MSKSRTPLYLGLAAAGAGGYYLYRAGGDVQGAKKEMKGGFPNFHGCDTGQAKLIPSQSTLERPARRCPLAGMRREWARRSARRLAPVWTKLYVSLLSLLSRCVYQIASTP